MSFGEKAEDVGGKGPAGSWAKHSPSLPHYNGHDPCRHSQVVQVSFTSSHPILLLSQQSSRTLHLVIFLKTFMTLVTIIEIIYYFFVNGFPVLRLALKME